MNSVNPTFTECITLTNSPRYDSSLQTDVEGLPCGADNHTPKQVSLNDEHMIGTPRQLDDFICRMPGRAATRVFILALVGLLSIAACGVSVEHKHPSHLALQPGDANYPDPNASPAQVVKFTAKVPNGLSPEFHLIYNVEWDQDKHDPNTITSSPGCAWTQQAQFFVSMTMKLVNTGDLYVGSFSPDIFQAGVCRWHLTEMTSPNVRPGIVHFGHSFHSNGHPLPDLDLTTQVVHIWCTRKGKDQPRKSSIPNELIDCVPFQMIEIAKLPLGFNESVPAKEKEWNIHVTQYLRSLTVEFHDLDALILAYIESHRSDASTTR
jgi:hypothetical protein